MNLIKKEEKIDKCHKIQIKSSGFRYMYRSGDEGIESSSIDSDFWQVLSPGSQNS